MPVEIAPVTHGTFRHDADTEWGSEVNQVKDDSAEITPTGFVTLVRDGWIAPSGNMVAEDDLGDDESGRPRLVWKPWTRIASSLTIVETADYLALRAELKRLQAEVARLQVLGEAVEKVDGKIRKTDVGQFWMMDGAVTIDLMSGEWSREPTFAAALVALAEKGA